jgi:hypothetical protein
MNWKKVLRITAVTVIPGGLVALGAWAVVKKLRSSDRETKNAKAKAAKVNQQYAKEEAKDDIHSIGDK